MFKQEVDFKMYGSGDSAWAVGLIEDVKQAFGMVQQVINQLSKDWGVGSQVLIDRKLGKDTAALAIKVAKASYLATGYRANWDAIRKNGTNGWYLATWARELISQADQGLFANAASAQKAMNWNTTAILKGESGIVGTITGSKDIPSSPPAGIQAPLGLPVSMTEAGILGVLGYFVYKKYSKRK